MVVAARITFKGRCYSLGGFDTDEEATSAYDLALASLRRGDFNLPDRRERARTELVLARQLSGMPPAAAALCSLRGGPRI